MFGKKKEAKDNNEITIGYDKYNEMGDFKKSFSKKSRMRIGTAMLKERVGEIEMHLGFYPILMSKDDKLGDYLVMEYFGEFQFIDNPAPKDWTPSYDKKIGKILEIVKYAEDDFRIKKKVDETYYYKVQKEQTQIVDVEDPETGEMVSTAEVVKDEMDEIQYEDVEIPYNEPAIVTEEGRDAIRKTNEYKIRMAEKRKTTQGFWDKWGAQIIFITAIALCVIMVIGSVKLQGDQQLEAAKMFKEGFDKAAETSKSLINVDAIADRVVQKTQEKEDEANAPPK